MKKLFYLYFICFQLSIFSQDIKYHKGEINDSILVNSDLKESFALYLPNQFVLSKLSPIVFIFDPMARGKTGIYPFIKAAEKYGYILVCSNDSKNGPYENNFEIANRLFDKVFNDFNIDKNRVYTAGFSGGSRLASTIAVLTNKIQGVVACGAGFSLNKGHLPYIDNFSYAAIVGDEDMNYKEMSNTKELLDRLNISNELFIYEINHSWPTQDQILDAIDWLQLEAYEKGIIPISKKNLKDTYVGYYKKSKMFEENAALLYASYEYTRILRNFSSYFGLDSIRRKLIVLKNRKPFKKQEKLLHSSFKEEVLLSDKFIDKFNEDFSKNNRDLKWWKSQISKLQKNIQTAKPVQKKMLKRLLYKIFALAIETVSLGNKIKHIDQSIFCYDICIIIYPKYPFPYFKQIENFINKNNESVALDYLEALLNNGYSDYEKIREYKGFKSLMNRERFMQLVNN